MGRRNIEEWGGGICRGVGRRNIEGGEEYRGVGSNIEGGEEGM